MKYLLIIPMFAMSLLFAGEASACPLFGAYRVESRVYVRAPVVQRVVVQPAPVVVRYRTYQYRYEVRRPAPVVYYRSVAPRTVIEAPAAVVAPEPSTEEVEWTATHPGYRKYKSESKTYRDGRTKVKVDVRY